MAKLIVRVIGCRNLPRTDFGGLGKMDPYVRVRLAGQVYRTKTKSDNLNPVFNETFEFIDPPGTDAIIFELYDDDVTSSKFIGKVSLSSDHLPQGPTRLGFPNTYNRKSGGELEVEVYRQYPGGGGYGGGYGAPSYGAPSYGAPSYGAPSYGAPPPQQYAPQYNAPPPPQQYAPQYAAPPQYAPQYAPQYTAPPPVYVQQSYPPQYGAPPPVYVQPSYAPQVPVVYATPPSGYSTYGGFSG